MRQGPREKSEKKNIPLYGCWPPVFLQDLDQFRQSQEGTNRTSHPVTVIRISVEDRRKHQVQILANWAQKTSDE